MAKLQLYYFLKVSHPQENFCPESMAWKVEFFQNFNNLEKKLKGNPVRMKILIQHLQDSFI
jgi:hypothetical protein